MPAGWVATFSLNLDTGQNYDAIPSFFAAFHGSDSHHQLHKNSHPLWVAVFMAFSGRESEGGSEKAPVGLF